MVAAAVANSPCLVSRARLYLARLQHVLFLVVVSDQRDPPSGRRRPVVYHKESSRNAGSPRQPPGLLTKK